MTDIQENKPITRYWPLIALILVAMLAAFALRHSTDGDHLKWMHYFMGFFLSQFALLKLFHPRGFTDGFQIYDILAKKSRIYAYIYPLIELALALGYLSFFMPMLVYLITIAVMVFGAIGVIKALKEGLDLRCACMGTALDVPLSTVTLTEDIGMSVLALIMLIMQ